LNAVSQFQLQFQPGLTEQFRTFRQVLAAAVYGCRIGLNGVASECDVSPSLLSRMLNENQDDPRHLPADLVPKIIKASGDHRPIHWLIETFLQDEDTRQRQALETITHLLPTLQEAVATLKKPKR